MKPPPLPLPPPAISTLQRLCLWLEALRPYRLSFEDLTGVSYDVPEMSLDQVHRYHSGELCMRAKEAGTFRFRCHDDKALANAVVLRGGAGVCGQCHLGLTDMAEPLRYHGQVLGVFYYGSVVLRDTDAVASAGTGSEEAARRRLQRKCAREHLPADALLEAFDVMPRTTPAELRRAHADLLLLVQLTCNMLENLGLPLDAYRTQLRASQARAHRALSPLVRKAMRFISQHYAEPLGIAEIAKAVQCHPRHLGRAFRLSTGETVMQSLLRIRIDHACRLLRLGQYTITQIAYETGFQEKSHFTRVFKRLTGMTPSEYPRG